MYCTKRKTIAVLAVISILLAGVPCFSEETNIPEQNKDILIPAESEDIIMRGSTNPSQYAFTPDDICLLDDLEKRIVMFFWNEVYPSSGIAIDHTENRTGKVAATGFELAAICIGIERGWIPREDGYNRVLTILNMFYDDPENPDDVHAEGQFGLWWHFVDGNTGKMKPVDCVAICDSADFIAGALVTGEYFKNTPAGDLAGKIIAQVEWDKFVLKDKDGKPDILSFGWVPLHTSKGAYYEIDGLLPFGMNWLTDNSLLIYAMALGSETHPIPPETWMAYKRDRRIEEYQGIQCTAGGALFVRQVPHAFIRFSRKQDETIDYFNDTVQALLADRAFNVKENGYPDTLWGLNDCFGKDSYSHSAPPGPVMNDGTVATTSFAGALPHIPRLSLKAMHYALQNYRDKVWGEYGFRSSINLKNHFFSPLYVGIELGPMLLLIENARTGFIWDLFMQTATMKNFIQRAGMRGVIDDFELSPEAPAYAQWEIDSGTQKRTDKAAYFGKSCLELFPEKETFILTGTLPNNDLLDFHYNDILSFQVRDFIPKQIHLVINSNEYALDACPERNKETSQWTSCSFMLPTSHPGDQIERIIITGRKTGPQPAMDTLILEAK